MYYRIHSNTNKINVISTYVLQLLTNNKNKKIDHSRANYVLIIPYCNCKYYFYYDYIICLIVLKIIHAIMIVFRYLLLSKKKWKLNNGIKKNYTKSYFISVVSIVDRNVATDRQTKILWFQLKKRFGRLIRIIIKTTFLFLGGTTLLALYLMFGGAAQLLCNIIAVAYPAYISIKAIETSTKEDDTNWLIYWTLYAIFSVLEFFSGYLYAVIPFYYLLKVWLVHRLANSKIYGNNIFFILLLQCIFFIWCMLPIPNNGSHVVYAKIVRPYFLKHQATTDDAIDKLTGKAKEFISDTFKKD